MATEATTERRESADGETELGVDPKVLSVLGYVFNVVGALVLLVLEDNDFVRHHAAQSLVFTGAAVVASIVAAILASLLGWIPLVGGLIELVLGLGLRAAIVLGFVFLAYKAYSGERYTLPGFEGPIDSVEGAF